MSTNSKPVTPKPFTVFELYQILSRAMAENFKFSELQIADITIDLLVTPPASPVIEGMTESPASKAHALDALVAELAPTVQKFYVQVDAAQDAGDLWMQGHIQVVQATSSDDLEKLNPIKH